MLTVINETTGCLICGRPLAYLAYAADRICTLCGAHVASTAICESGHFVCDRCHSASANEIIERSANESTSTDPMEIAVQILQSPALHMHGPEHHFLVPAVLLAAHDNRHHRPQAKVDHLREARRRAQKVPGGFCGTHGDCGAAVGTGIFWSIVTEATPLSRDAWAQAHRMTAHSLLRVADHGGPRCCKRDTFLAIQQAVLDVEQIEGSAWPCRTAKCRHSSHNRQCRGAECPFFSTAPEPSPLECA